MFREGHQAGCRLKVALELSTLPIENRGTVPSPLARAPGESGRVRTHRLTLSMAKKAKGGGGRRAKVVKVKKPKAKKAPKAKAPKPAKVPKATKAKMGQRAAGHFLSAANKLGGSARKDLQKAAGCMIKAHT